MPYIFDATANPNVDPAAGDKLSLGDISDTTNNASGDTKTTTVQQVANWLEINAQTGTSYTAVLGDRAKLVTMNNASANTFTIPTNASVAYPTGSCLLVQQIGAGVTTIAGNTGVTIQGGGQSVSAGSCAISNRYDLATCVKTGTDQWLVQGSVGAIA